MDDRPKFLLELFLDVLAAAGSPDFRRASDRFVVEYKRSSKPDQGAYHGLLAADHKRWAAEHPA